MFSRKHIFIIGIIIVLFALGLIGFFIFSAPYGDGLEKTMEKGDAGEGDHLIPAPFDYGDSYSVAFFMGCLGFVITLTGVYLLTKFMGKKDAS